MFCLKKPQLYIFLLVLYLLFPITTFSKNPYSAEMKALLKGDFQKVEQFIVSQEISKLSNEHKIWLNLFKAEFYYQIRIIEKYKLYTDLASTMLKNEKQFNIELVIEVEYFLARYFHYHAKPHLALNHINKSINLAFKVAGSLFKDNIFKFYITKASIYRNIDRNNAAKYFRLAYIYIDKGENYFNDGYEFFKSLGNYYLDPVSKGDTISYLLALKYFNLANDFNSKGHNNQYIIAYLNYLTALTHLNCNKPQKASLFFHKSTLLLTNLKGKNLWKMGILINVLTYRNKAYKNALSNSEFLNFIRNDNALLINLLPYWKKWYSLNTTKETGLNRDIYAVSPYNVLISNLIYEYKHVPSETLFDSIISLINHTKLFNSVDLKFTKKLTSADVQNRLKSSEMILDFFDNHSDDVFIVMISKGSTKLLSIKNPDAKEIEGLQLALNKPGAISDFKRSSFLIYNKIWKQLKNNIPENINTINIIPHKTISLINFDVLISDTSSKQFKYLPFLIKKYRFNYQYTLESFIENQKANISYRSTSFYFDNLEESDLPSLHNLNTISKNTDYFTPYSISISKQNLIKLFKESSLIQLTSHYVQNYKLMEHDSYVSSSLSNNESLSLSELIKLKTKANLVVYAICNSNIGHKFSSHQIQSLPYYTIHNGARSCVFTMGNLDDYSGATILNSFYKNLLNGESTLKSLHDAKIEYLNKGKPDNENHPFYWTNFQLVGKNVSLEELRERDCESSLWLYPNLSIILWLYKNAL